VIRRSNPEDVATIYSVINDAARAYEGVIPHDRWNDPYMPMEELLGEIEDGVEFWLYEEDGETVGAMGIQDVDDVTLIRHSYVRGEWRNKGIGGNLLAELLEMARLPVLIGTWNDAVWAVGFYEKHGFQRLSDEESARLLERYWNIPARQVETSIVLAEPRWFERDKGE
jgi:GNAT superfamily N-acetyltransferase